MAPERFGEEATYAATRLPVDHASTLIPHAYTTEEFDALERERVFGTAWVPVCVTDEVRDPGSFLAVEVGGRSLIVCRNRERRAPRPPQRLPSPRRPARHGTAG